MSKRSQNAGWSNPDELGHAASREFSGDGAVTARGHLSFFRSDHGRYTSPSELANFAFGAGDGAGRHEVSNAGRSENLQLSIAPCETNSIIGNQAPPSLQTTVDLVTKSTPSNEFWKLVGLVVVFLAWISTAGALLFVYMDRYFFG